jgi:hypothetical protein
MATDFFGAVGAVIEWAKAPVKPMLILCAMSAFALFAPLRWKSAMQIQVLTADHFGLLWVIFGFSSLYLVLTCVHEIGKRLVRPIQRFRAKRSMEFVFRDLPADEFFIVWGFVTSGRTVKHFLSGAFDAQASSTEGALMDLVSKGVLQPAGAVSDTWTDRLAFALTPEANSYLRNPHVQQLLRKRLEAGKKSVQKS